jgi:flagellar export protein FliJ
MAKRFVFGLQTALDVRSQRVDALLAEMTKAQQQVVLAQQERQGWIDELNNARTASGLMTGNASLQLAENWPLIQERLGQAIRQCQQKEQHWQAMVSQIQQHLQQAVVDHKALETLKTRQHKAHQTAMLKAEETALEDIMQARWKAPV